jgi:hypothetical protein
MKRDEVLAYLADFDLAVERLGDVILEGKQHAVYRYGDDQIIKVPKRSLYMKLYGAIDYDAVLRDVTLLQTHLSEFIVPTQVLQSRRSPDQYVIVQTYLPDATFITGDRFPAIRDDFARIVAVNRQFIEQYRLSIDFFGNIGFQRSIIASLLRRRDLALLNNLLLVERAGRPYIKITDVNLSELRLWWRADVKLFHWIVDSAVFTITRLLIRDHFGIEC